MYRYELFRSGGGMRLHHACNAANMVSIVCFKYRLQPKPRSVLINSNRVDKRVFLSAQYAIVRCANGQSVQLPISQLAYASSLHQSTLILSITFHFQYSWLSMYYNICYVEDLHRCRLLFDLSPRLNEYQIGRA